MTTDETIAFLADGPEDAPWRVILAHGAGAPMDSDFMSAMAAELSARGVGVLRFEFPYMKRRRQEGTKRPPDRAPVLLAAWRAAVAHAAAAYPNTRLAIGGKSMGGRMATLLTAEPDCPPEVRAVVTLGYPFHPPGQLDKLRTDHFGSIGLPVLMVQGTRDPFGREAEVPGYSLPPRATVFWSVDGNHDLKPRKLSGRTHPQAIAEAAETIAYFLNFE